MFSEFIYARLRLLTATASARLHLLRFYTSVTCETARVCFKARLHPRHWLNIWRFVRGERVRSAAKYEPPR